MSNLKNQLIKLGSENPNLQKHIRPVLDKISSTMKKVKNVKEGDKIQLGAGPNPKQFEVLEISPHHLEPNTLVLRLSGQAGKEQFKFEKDDTVEVVG